MTERSGATRRLRRPKQKLTRTAEKTDLIESETESERGLDHYEAVGVE